MKPETKYCAERVTSQGGWHSHHCQRKAGHGPKKAYCKQHATKHLTDVVGRVWVLANRSYRRDDLPMCVDVLAETEKTVTVKGLWMSGGIDTLKKEADLEWKVFGSEADALECLAERLMSRLDGLQRSADEAAHKLKKVRDALSAIYLVDAARDVLTDKSENKESEDV